MTNASSNDNHEGHLDENVSDEELHSYLSQIAEHIGWVIIHFNSLEDLIAQLLREVMLKDPYQDERLDVFMAEMGYKAKASALMHLYGQMLAQGVARLPSNEIVRLENALFLAASIRNGYAHADWIGLRPGNYIKVKTQSQRIGITHRYKHIDITRAELDINFIKSVRDRIEAVHGLIQEQIYQPADLSNITSCKLPDLAYPTVDTSGNVPLTSEQIEVMNALITLGYPNISVLNAVRSTSAKLSVKSAIKHVLALLDENR